MQAGERTVAKCWCTNTERPRRAQDASETGKKEKEIRGLLVCIQCSKLLNRDYNAARNIARAARADLNDNESVVLVQGRRRKQVHKTSGLIHRLRRDCKGLAQMSEWER